MTLIHPITNRSDFDRGIEIAREALRRDEVISFPVEHGYAVAAEPFASSAIRAIQAARGAAGSALPVLIGTQQMLDGIAKPLSSEVRALLVGLWPGLLTIVVPAAVSWDLGDGASGQIAVRQPNDPIALALLRHGPLAATSAARAGHSASTAVEVAEELGDEVAVILDAGPRPAGPASTMVALAGRGYRVLREGAVSREVLAAHAEGLVLES